MQLREESLLLAGYLLGSAFPLHPRIKQAIDAITSGDPAPILKVTQKDDQALTIDRVLAKPKVDLADITKELTDIDLDNVPEAVITLKPKKPMTADRLAKLQAVAAMGRAARAAKKGDASNREERVAPSAGVNALPAATATEMPSPAINTSRFIDRARAAVKGVLKDEDWKDIKYRMVSLNHSRTSIASDYDCTEEEVDAFIRTQQHADKSRMADDFEDNDLGEARSR